MARTRTTKKLAQRIDLNYFKRPTPLKRLKIWLSILAPLVALVWIGWHFAAHNSRVYSSGRLANPHTVFETQCEACHVREGSEYSSKAENSACLACHDGPIHHEFEKSMECSDCHIEHRGRKKLSAVNNESCALCHDGLARRNWGHVIDFGEHHPQFSAVLGVDGQPPRDPGTIKLNHMLHMKPIRRSPNGPNVQLTCGDCHRTAAGVEKSPWPYADGRYVAAPVSYTDKDNFLPAATSGLMRHNPATSRELMAPVKFAAACAACHLLTFDKRFDEGVPHDKPEVIHNFLVKKFSAYIAANPGELHEMQDPGRGLSGGPVPARIRTLTSPQWVQEKVAVAEELLTHKTCTQCHQMGTGNLQDTSIARWATRVATEQSSSAWMAVPEKPAIKTIPIPMVAQANTTLRWLPHSKFDHDAHTGFTCTSCHEKALTSTETSDILIPGIATCQTCHAPGPNHAESRCFECHTYHDWSKRKEVTPTFRLPALHTGM